MASQADRVDEAEEDSTDRWLLGLRQSDFTELPELTDVATQLFYQQVSTAHQSASLLVLTVASLMKIAIANVSDHQRNKPLRAHTLIRTSLNNFPIKCIQPILSWGIS